MKHIRCSLILPTVALLALLAGNIGAAPVGTAFTYQGRLTDGSGPATGSYDLRFIIYDLASDGSVVAGPLTNCPVAITNGLLTVTLDFGADVFTDAARWLEVAVRLNGMSGDFTVLTPRQLLTPAPYAITAFNLAEPLPGSGLVGNYTNAVTFSNPANQFTGNHAGNGAGLSNVSATTLEGLASAAFWKTGGNSGTVAGTNFLGTVDARPLEFRVNNTVAFRLQPGNNVVGGSIYNNISSDIIGATIAGGGNWNRENESYAHQVWGNYGTVSGGSGNGAQAEHATVAGGRENKARGKQSVISGGYDNLIDADATDALIAGGEGNMIGTNAPASAIGGGLLNAIGDGAPYAVIGGGQENFVQEGASLGIVGGGLGNIIGSSPYSVIAGGRYNSLWGGSTDITISGGQSNVVQEHAYGATIAGGEGNTVGGSGSGSAIGGGRGNAVSGGSWGSTIGGGQGNTISGGSGYATIAGGGGNIASGHAATVAGGENNTSSGYQAAVGGGSGNLSAGDDATVAGGRLNTSQGEGATVSGGANNRSRAEYGTIAGGLFNTNEGWATTVGGGTANLSRGEGATVGGGGANVCLGLWSTVAGGNGNLIQPDADYTTVSGGATNVIQSTAEYATIGGGAGNLIRWDAENATIGGGGHNFISDSEFATISGGLSNITHGAYAAIGGGSLNSSSGTWAMVPGGIGNTAGGETSFAAGRRAQALHNGAFVWGDSTDADIASTNANSWTVRASGGVTFFTATNLASGATLPAGSGSWSTLSDRAAKDDLQPVDGRSVLDKLARMPLSTWRYKAQASGVRHLGPMAQDFSAAFGVGEDDRHISSVDADGVTLAAIQGLNEVVKEKDAKIAELEKRLTTLEELLRLHAQGGNERDLK